MTTSLEGCDYSENFQLFVNVTFDAYLVVIEDVILTTREKRDKFIFVRFCRYSVAGKLFAIRSQLTIY